MDLNKIKSKLNTIKSNGSSGAKSPHLFQVPDGKTTVRIVPLKSNPDWPFFEAYFHYGMNKRTYVSPITYGNADPIMEFAQDAQEAAQDKDQWKQAKQLEPKRRVYAPILVRGKESEGVKFWGFSDSIYEAILGLCEDPDYGDITDLEKGTDLVIHKKTPEEVGNKYGETSITPKRNASPVAPDNKINEVVKLIQDQPLLEDIEYFKAADYDTLSEALHKYLNLRESDENESGDTGFGNASAALEKAVEAQPQPSAEVTAEATSEEQPAKPNFDNLFG